MKLAAIYNVWEDEHLLDSINLIREHVDYIILIYQNISNYFEIYHPNIKIDDAIAIRYFPLAISPMQNEINKRQLGIDTAKTLNCTHFLHLDCDEMHFDFEKGKQEYINSGANGSVCEMYTYFQSKNYRLENVDNYFVPFIHKLDTNTVCGVKKYPFYTDPTRRINTENVVKLNHKMHHYSWIRSNIERKIRNSTAKKNIEKSNLLKDYYSDLYDGYYLQDYRQKLIQIKIDNNK